MEQLPELFTNIANAIREKKGTTELINAVDFPNEISNIDFTTFEDYQKCLELTEYILGKDEVVLEEDYIEFNGTSYIILPTIIQNNYRYYIKFQATGNRDSEKFLSLKDGIAWIGRWGSFDKFQTYRLTVTNEIIPTTSPEEREFYATNWGGYQLVLGGINGTPYTYSNFKFYYLKGYDTSGNLVNNIVPANSEIFGERTLIDKVTGEIISY